MSHIMRVLHVLLLAAPLCSSFSHHSPPRSRARITSSTQQHATQKNEIVERAGQAAGTAFLALTLSFASVEAPAPATAATSARLSTVPEASAMTSITLSKRGQASDEDLAIKFLEEETREVEREVKVEAKKARVEKSREAFFEYEAKMAKQTEDRIEAAERKAEEEYEADKEEAELLKEMEEKAEKEVQLARTAKEKAQAKKEAQLLLKREKEYERKEKAAARREKIFLAEEQQEQKILKKKLDAERAEEAVYEAVETEYESELELAKEDELELKLAKDLLKKK